MNLTKLAVAIVLVFAATACNRKSSIDEDEGSSPASVSTTVSQNLGKATSTTTVDEVVTGEVLSPAADPEVVFTGPLEISEGSLVVRYRSNSWYRESGIATLPTVGVLQWFLDTEDGCLAVDRSALIDATGEGYEITMIPAPEGEISIGESNPLWIEGDWLIHDGCSRGHPIIHRGQ